MVESVPLNTMVSIGYAGLVTNEMPEPEYVIDNRLRRGQAFGKRGKGLRAAPDHRAVILSGRFENAVEL
jgi:hypothetical protein